MTWSAVEAVILDMDGLLIDTEPVWRAAQAAVFAGIGIALRESDLLDSTGQPVEELIPVWRRRSGEGDRTSLLTNTGLTDAQVERRATAAKEGIDSYLLELVRRGLVERKISQGRAAEILDMTVAEAGAFLAAAGVAL